MDNGHGLRHDVCCIRLALAQQHYGGFPGNIRPRLNRLFSEIQLNGLLTTLRIRGRAQGFKRRSLRLRHREDRAGLPLGTKNLLRLLRLRREYPCLALPLRHVNRRLALTFRLQHHGALLALSLHLPFHGI